MIENDFALKTHICNGQKPTMDRHNKSNTVYLRVCVGVCVREREENSSTRTSKRNYIHALNFALGSWPLNEVENNER